MSMASDYDNPIKIFQDVLCKKYGFNDNRIFAAHQYKILVPKGEEFIKFENFCSVC
jgi:Holliday junction resolvase RusA-like endonuclease